MKQGLFATAGVHNSVPLSEEGRTQNRDRMSKGHQLREIPLAGQEEAACPGAEGLLQQAGEVALKNKQKNLTAVELSFQLVSPLSSIARLDSGLHVVPLLDGTVGEAWPCSRRSLWQLSSLSSCCRRCLGCQAAHGDLPGGAGQESHWGRLRKHAAVCFSAGEEQEQL